MRKYNIKLAILALTSVFLLGPGTLQISMAQTAGNDPTICYRVTGLPSQGVVTMSTSGNIHEAVQTGDFFNFPPDLVFTAPDTEGSYTFDYEITDLSFVPTGVGTCSETPQSCAPPFFSQSSCPTNEICIEDIDSVCATSPILDSATVTFNISDFDPCPADGRQSGCGPDTE